ncbi:hypothetical protein ACQP2K_24105 [Microbispora siamensis]
MLRPDTLMPWEAAIAERCTAGWTPEYVAHQRPGHDWPRGLLETTGLDEQALPLTLGGPGPGRGPRRLLLRAVHPNGAPVILGIDHIGLATDDPAGTAPFLAALGLGAGDLGIADDYGSYWSWFFSA